MESTTKKNPHKGHRERVREKYIKNGLDAFHEHEVLEMLLFYCYPQRDTNEISHGMLDKFQSLSNLFETDVDVLMKTLNCSKNVAVLLNLVPALSKRYSQSRWEGSGKIVLDKLERAAKYAMDLFIGETVEHFYVINMDAKCRLINTVLISKGTINEVATYPRKIADEISRSRASRIILTHNHPGGTIKPSPGDNEATRKISNGLTFLDVDLIDHIIVTGDKYYSYALRSHGGFVKGYDI